MRGADHRWRASDPGAGVPLGAPEDQRPMDRLISMAINAELDGISFTSAPAVASMLGRAKATGRLMSCWPRCGPGWRRCALDR